MRFDVLILLIFEGTINIVFTLFTVYFSSVVQGTIGRGFNLGGALVSETRA